MDFDVIIVGTGPAGLGAAFELTEHSNKLKILMVDKEKICSGGLRNDCKQNYTYPIGFTTEYWGEDNANRLLEKVKKYLKPKLLSKNNLELYQKRANKINSSLIDVAQYHVGTDKSVKLIEGLMDELRDRGVTIKLETEVQQVNSKSIVIGGEEIGFKKVILGTGRKGFSFLQEQMEKLEIKYIDNVVDIGIRIETSLKNYPIVKDYYDPKFYFPEKVRTFCTNSGKALVTKEHYNGFKIVNGHALSSERGENNLVNFALLKTIHLKDPVRSGQQMAVYLARLANEIGGGEPIMQRVGDFRMGKRSKEETFNEDPYDFRPTCKACAGDLGLAVPSKIMRDLWSAMKKLDTVIPGLLHPSTIMYYPEIKMYANRPQFIDEHFMVKENIYMIGDGAGTSRGITGAWASGIRSAEGIIKALNQ